jgi:hypothetical protein
MSGNQGGADGSLIATTRNAELQALGTGGQLAVQVWDQIAGYLRRNRSPAHAALFAEPNPDPDRGVTDWYAEGVGEGPPLASLPQPAQHAARAEFTRLVTDIQADIESLRRSSRENERFLGELLALALITPAEENLRVVGTQPVLVAWAHTRVGEAPAPQLLIGMMARRPGGVAPGVAPMRILGPPAAVRRTPWLAIGLAAATLLLLVLLLLLLWLDPFRWFRATPPQCVVQQDGIELLHQLRTEEAHETRLRAEIARLTLGLGDRRLACPPSEPLRTDPVPPAAPPPAPSIRSADAERAREQGARGGRIQVILAWDDRNDLDLMILCPNGQRIFYDNRRACGGELDVDRNAGGTIAAQPVENVVFAAEPLPGRYRIIVSNYGHNPPSPSTSAFRVTLRREGQPDQVFTGRAAPGPAVEVGGFDSPGR